jgi:tight adherence protein B
MQPTLLLLVVYVAASLIVAAVIFLWRDLSSRGRAAAGEELGDAEKPLNLEAVVLSAETAPGGVSETWFTRLVTETGSDFTPETAVLLAVFSGLAVGGALWLWRDDWLAGAAGAILGVVAVGGLLFYLRSRRQSAIRGQLPEVMEMMARAVRAGESLDQAIALAGNSAFRPVAAEFHQCASQMAVGLSLDAAMRGLVRRAPLAETRVLAMTLIVQRLRGGSLPTALERLAHVFRDRLAYYRQFRSATAAGRAAATLICIIALALDVVIILGRPEYARVLLESNPGRVILAASLALQVIGVTWALWLFRSDY